MISNKKAGADLLMELAMSTIIFFIIVFFLFGINIPKQELNACAKVVAADAALACETSMMNLLKANSPDGTKYADFLMNGWINNDLKDWCKDANKLKGWCGNVSDIFDDVFGAGDWEMEVLLPNGTNITPKLGNITTKQLGCSYTIPYPAALLKKNCGFLETQTPTVSQEAQAEVTFGTPDGTANFTITDDDGAWLGADCIDGCTLDLEPKSIYEDTLSEKIPNNASEAEVLTLPVIISGSVYEITVEELTDTNDNVKSGFAVNVTLSQSTSLKNCGLTLTLKTTNITDMVQTCCAKGKCYSTQEIV